MAITDTNGRKQPVIRALSTSLPLLALVAGSVALVCVLIGTTSFDGFSQGAVWTGEDGLAERFTSVFTSLGLGQSAAVQAGYTAGLLVVIALVSALYWLGVAGMQSVGRDHSTADLARRFAHTLIPISLAYLVAHYFSLLLFQGQAIGEMRASDRNIKLVLEKSAAPAFAAFLTDKLPGLYEEFRALAASADASKDY